jgi:hypothetical protein
MGVLSEGGDDRGYRLEDAFWRPIHLGAAFIYDALKEVIDYLAKIPGTEQLDEKVRDALDCLVGNVGNPDWSDGAALLPESRRRSRS